MEQAQSTQAYVYPVYPLDNPCLYHKPRVKNTTLSIWILTRHFLVDFHPKNFVFSFIFISFFDEVSNFRNNILNTSDKNLSAEMLPIFFKKLEYFH